MPNDTIKPVARVIPDHSQGCKGVTKIAQTAEYELPEGASLYALPDTHRIVPVELLKSVARLTQWPEHHEVKKLQAIIDKEPT